MTLKAFRERKSVTRQRGGQEQHRRHQEIGAIALDFWVVLILNSTRHLTIHQTQKERHLQMWNFQINDPSVHPSFRRLLNNMCQQKKKKGRCGPREERPNKTHRWEVNWRLGHPTTVWKPKDQPLQTRRGDEDCKEGSREEKHSRQMQCVWSLKKVRWAAWFTPIIQAPRKLRQENPTWSKPSRIQSETLSQKFVKQINKMLKAVILKRSIRAFWVKGLGKSKEK